MIDRIIRSWRTTLVALVIAAIGATALFTDRSTLPESGAFFVTSITLLFSKDPKSAEK